MTNPSDYGLAALERALDQLRLPQCTADPRTQWNVLDAALQADIGGALTELERLRSLLLATREEP